MKNNSVDVSVSSCEERVRIKQYKEIRKNKIFTNFFALATFIAFGFMVVGIILAIIGMVRFTNPIISFGVFGFCFVVFGFLHSEGEKISKMTADEYVSMKLGEIAYHDNDIIRCPHCGSEHMTYQKKGFSEAKALIGMSLIGIWGVMFGVPGKHKIKATCLKCGHSFMIKKK